MQHFGQRIAEQRRKLGLSQYELANILGKSQQTIAAYETGRVKNLNKNSLNEIARALKCDIDWLTGVEEITLNKYPKEIQRWLAKDEAINYVIAAYAKYLQDSVK